jgi:DNA-binding LacI/PurR family transcriptional regulator
VDPDVTVEPMVPAVPGRPATIYDVARAAGVSHQTVSRLLGGYKGIRPVTREKVERALALLDYRPNMAARSLATNRSRRIGALTHEIDQVGPSKIVQGASTAAHEAGYLMDVVTLDMGDPTAIDEALDLIIQHEVAGVLALASTDEMKLAFETTDFRVPAYIAIEEDDATTGKHIDADSGIPALITLLARLGHRRYFHIGGPMTWSAARNRRHAYEDALKATGGTSLGVAHGDWSSLSGYQIARNIPIVGGVTAIVAANDQMALGAMLALSQRGFSVPGDVSVTGVDDIPEAAFFNPPLTTLGVDFIAQGRAGFEELLARISGTESKKNPLPLALPVIRSSTGPAHP